MKKIFVVISILLLAGCSNVGVTQLKNLDSKPENCPIDIYLSQSEVKRTFENVCFIDSRTGTTAGHTKTAAAAIDQAKSYACKCGADAMVVKSADTEGATMTTWGQGKAMLIGIKYTD